MDTFAWTEKGEIWLIFSILSIRSLVIICIVYLHLQSLPQAIDRNNVPNHYLQSSTTHNEDLYFSDFVTLWNEITLSINCYEMSSVVIFEINTDQTVLRNKINHIFRGVCMPSISIQTHTNPSHGEDKR